MISASLKSNSISNGVQTIVLEASEEDIRKLSNREKLYVSGNRKRDNISIKVKDTRSRSRLYAKC